LQGFWGGQELGYYGTVHTYLSLFGVQLHMQVIVWHYFLVSNECGFITDRERSMNCSRNSVFDLPHLVCCLLRECPESVPMPHH